MGFPRQPSTQPTQSATPVPETMVQEAQTPLPVQNVGQETTAPVVSSLAKKPDKPKFKRRKILKFPVNPLKPAVIGLFASTCAAGREVISEEYEDCDEEIEEESSECDRHNIKKNKENSNNISKNEEIKSIVDSDSVMKVLDNQDIVLNQCDVDCTNNIVDKNDTRSVNCVNDSGENGNIDCNSKHNSNSENINTLSHKLENQTKVINCKETVQ